MPISEEIQLREMKFSLSFLVQIIGHLLSLTNFTGGIVLPIGGIFEDNPHEEDEITFRAAIDLINKEKLFAPIKFRPVVAHVVPENIVQPTTGEIIGVNWDQPFAAQSAVCSILSQGVAGVLTSSYDNNANTIQSICDAKEIPFVRATQDKVHGRECCSINIFPNIEVISTALADLVLKLKWKNFTIVYETNDDLGDVAELLKLYNSTGYSVSLCQVWKNGYLGYRESLKKLRLSNQTKFVVHTEIESLEEIFDHIQQVGLVMNKYQFIIVNLDTHTLDFHKFQHSKTKILALQFVDPNSSKASMLAQYVIKKKIELGVEILSHNVTEAAWKIQSEAALLMDTLQLMAEAFKEIQLIRVKPFHCNLSNSWEHGSTIYNYMKMKTFNGLTGPVHFNQRGFRNDISLNVIELEEDGFRKIATWNSREQITFLPSYLDSLGMGKLNNTTLKVMICWSEPYAFYKNDSSVLKGNDQFEGFIVDIMREISKLEGFAYKLVRNEDDKNGDYNPATQKWNGMIGDILNGVGDIAIGDIMVTQQRQQFVDFTTPFMSAGIKIVFKKPTAEPKFFAFADLFHIKIWILIAVFYVVVSLILFISAHFSPPEWENWNPCIQNPRYCVNEFTLRNSFWYVLGALMQQGVDFAPRGTSTRILSSAWAFFILIIVSYYKAQLTAFLTIDQQYLPFYSVEELVANAQKLGIRYGAIKDEAVHTFFRESPNPVHQKIVQYMKDHPEEMVEDNWEGYLKLEEGNYAYFTDSVYAKFLTKVVCYMTTVGSSINERQFAIAMRKNSPYRYTLSKAILKLKEAGTIRELQEKWWSDAFVIEECKGQKVNALTPLNLHHVAGIFWITTLFIFASCIFVFFEFTIHSYYRSRVKKTNFREEFKQELSKNLKFQSTKKR